MSRKYRHRGYRDSESEDRDRSTGPPRQPLLTPEQRYQRRGLRHAMDRDAREVVRCHNCGRNVDHFGAIDPSTKCPHCAAELHCCRTCRHFDSGARHQCRAPITQPVEVKTRRNDCSEYASRLVLDVTGRRSSTTRPNDPKAQFENLFKR